MCFAWISEQTAIISLYNIDWPVFINEMVSVYCAVRTGCSYKTDYVSSLKIHHFQFAFTWIRPAMALAHRQNITHTSDYGTTVLLQHDSVCNTVVTFNWKVQHVA